MHNNEINYRALKDYELIYGKEFINKLKKDYRWFTKNVTKKTKCASHIPIIWADIIRMYYEFNDEISEKVLQIKEKFGRLEIYLSEPEFNDEEIVLYYKGCCHDRTVITKVLLEKRGINLKNERGYGCLARDW